MQSHSLDSSHKFIIILFQKLIYTYTCIHTVVISKSKLKLIQQFFSSLLLIRLLAIEVAVYKNGLLLYYKVYKAILLLYFIIYIYIYLFINEIKKYLYVCVFELKNTKFNYLLINIGWLWVFFCCCWDKTEGPTAFVEARKIKLNLYFEKILFEKKSTILWFWYEIKYLLLLLLLLFSSTETIDSNFDKAKFTCGAKILNNHESNHWYFN